MKRKALRVRSEGSIPPYVTEAESRKQRSDSPLCNSLPRETAWRLTHLPTGAPRLDAPDRDYSISLSHSGSYVALVLCEGQHGIGVDLQIASDKLPQIAPRFMSPAELAHYHQLLAAEESQAAREWLYTVWGLKEAAYKAYPPKVQRHLATNYIVSPHDAPVSTSWSSDKGSDSITRYTICADEGDDRPTLLTGYRLRSITTAPYHLTYVETIDFCNSLHLSQHVESSEVGKFNASSLQ